jgi:hypothetical protein
MADALGLINRQILLPKPNSLLKLMTYVPFGHVDEIRTAVFNAGAGQIGNYSECSFSAEGIGTFKAEADTNPFVGEIGKRHEEREMKLEVVFPNYLQSNIVNALKENHPYEEVAYDIIALQNTNENVGSGLLAELPQPMDAIAFLEKIKSAFGLTVIKHTPLLQKKVQKVALCGGAGSFLIKNAIANKADFYITSDIKYHEFFDAENKLVIADIGHWESEQFTPDLLNAILQRKFPTFAVLKSEVVTNPVRYFL